MSEQGVLEGGEMTEAQRRVRRVVREHHENLFKLRVLALQLGYGIEKILQSSGSGAAEKARFNFRLERFVDQLVQSVHERERYQLVATPWGDDPGEVFSYLVKMAIRRWFIGETTWIGGRPGSEVVPKIERLPPKPNGWHEDPELRKLYSLNELEPYLPLDEQRASGVTGFPVIKSANYCDLRRQDICQSFMIDQVYESIIADRDYGGLRYVGQRRERGIDVCLVDLFYGWEPWARNMRMKSLSKREVEGIGEVNGRQVALAGPEVLALLATDPGFRFRLGTHDFPNLLLSAYRINVGGKEATPTLVRRLNRLELGYYFYDYENGTQTAHFSAPKVIVTPESKVR